MLEALLEVPDRTMKPVKSNVMSSSVGGSLHVLSPLTALPNHNPVLIVFPYSDTHLVWLISN